MDETPPVSARFARCLRGLAHLRGWQGLVNRLLPAASGAFTAVNRGTVFTGNLASFIDRQVFLFGGFEVEEIAVFLERVPAGRRGVVLDVGANAGTHSLAFSRVFRTVQAFEPNPALWPQFERNLALNGIDNVHLHRIGLADRDEELTLHLIDKPNFGLGTFATAEQYDLPLRPAAICPVRHAGRYLAELGLERVDAIKIDVQGFEPEVLRGLEPILQRDHPLVWCEIGAETLAKVPSRDALAQLVPFPFRCLQMQPRTRQVRRRIELVDRAGPLTVGDYLLQPEAM